ncbi:MULTISPECIES: ATP-binding protein [unclassified Campylobacter]|uniref:ATP-binding protein n=1 Tax=unclassified Campylobacter TaxID=2593542 RepID=UPI0022EA0927|nr:MULTISPECIES: ATP-binding protein [unclassified Campylobacter]MDA3079391.1 ATP-binding protein [Campylobacter sp. CS_NA2]MDA3081176.1 ATP-binding protein [Campylobacter sp. CS_NA1]MDA3085727.1 ATP-binding protein [Campylobacter sp. CS_ED1]MDA3090225.1 ATP-binding protein [Campylobacter sp. CS_ED2]WBR50990.1 ATP-binding protein [Campylobacter sp. CS_NA3]
MKLDKQQSFVNLKNMAEKFYKNKHNGVELILREAISNSIHACIIQKETFKEESYQAKIHIKIQENQNGGIIVIEDNGIGFSEIDKEMLFDLGSSNETKINHRLPTKGLGRLVFVYYANQITIQTTNNNKFSSFSYPASLGLYIDSVNKDEKNNTKIEMVVNKQYMKTFSDKFKNNLQLLSDWILDNFVFLIHDFAELTILLEFNGEQKIVNLDSAKNEDFYINIGDNQYEAKMLEINSNKFEIKLIAHRLLIDTEIAYSKNIENYKNRLYISSTILDERITPNGLSADIKDIKDELEQSISNYLDKKFNKEIKEQKELSQKNLSKAKNKFPFLSEFMPKYDDISGVKIEEENDFVNSAIMSKGEVEKNFWLSNKNEQLDERLQKSALYLYIKHRERVLIALEQMLGNSKFNENDFHQLLTDRKCENLDLANHNLWLLDDKFSYFMEAHNAKQGENAVDFLFYPYFDNQESPMQIVLLELKKPTKAHNTGKMINQIQEYAAKIYDNHKTPSGIHFEPNNCKFFGYIIADIDDIKKEEKGQNKGTFKEIPYANGSYEGTISFSPKNTDRQDIFVTLLSIQDLISIAKIRNKTFFNMLKMPNP